jgi:hypothetical protein
MKNFEKQDNNFKDPEWVAILRELCSREKEKVECKERKLTDYI